MRLSLVGASALLECGGSTPLCRGAATRRGGAAQDPCEASAVADCARPPRLSSRVPMGFIGARDLHFGFSLFDCRLSSFAFRISVFLYGRPPLQRWPLAALPFYVLRISIFEFRLSNFEFRFSNFDFRFSNFDFRVSNFAFNARGERSGRCAAATSQRAR